MYSVLWQVPVYNNLLPFLYISSKLTFHCHQSHGLQASKIQLNFGAVLNKHGLKELLHILQAELGLLAAQLCLLRCIYITLCSKQWRWQLCKHIIDIFRTEAELFKSWLQAADAHQALMVRAKAAEDACHLLLSPVHVI